MRRALGGCFGLLILGKASSSLRLCGNQGWKRCRKQSQKGGCTQCLQHDGKYRRRALARNINQKVEKGTGSVRFEAPSILLGPYVRAKPRKSTYIRRLFAAMTYAPSCRETVCQRVLPSWRLFARNTSCSRRQIQIISNSAVELCPVALDCFSQCVPFHLIGSRYAETRIVLHFERRKQFREIRSD